MLACQCGQGRLHIVQALEEELHGLIAAERERTGCSGGTMRLGDTGGD